MISLEKYVDFTVGRNLFGDTAILVNGRPLMSFNEENINEMLFANYVNGDEAAPVTVIEIAESIVGTLNTWFARHTDSI